MLAPLTGLDSSNLNRCLKCTFETVVSQAQADKSVVFRVQLGEINQAAVQPAKKNPALPGF